MGRSRKFTGKPTAKQNERAISEIEATVKQVIEAVGADLARVNGLIFGILDHFELIKEIECEDCGQKIVEPLLKALPRQDTCPACNKPLDPMQSRIEDWDNGVKKIEEV